MGLINWSSSECRSTGGSFYWYGRVRCVESGRNETTRQTTLTVYVDAVQSNGYAPQIQTDGALYGNGQTIAAGTGGTAWGTWTTVWSKSFTLNFNDDGTCPSLNVVGSNFKLKAHNDTGNTVNDFMSANWTFTPDSIQPNGSKVYINGQPYFVYINGNKYFQYINGVRY